jgi:hypothetical protein
VRVALEIIFFSQGVFRMSRTPIVVCLGAVALAAVLKAQAPPPTAYTIGGPLAGDSVGARRTLYRNGTKALAEVFRPAKPDGTAANHVFTLYDLATHFSYTWDPAIKPPSCSAARFSGDWGDPFESTAEVVAGIAKGELKAAGVETIAGIPVKVYAQTDPQATIKVWFDDKDGLVMRETYKAGSAPPQTVVDFRRVSFSPPAASLFVLPAACASAHPPPTPAELIAAETGDNAANYVSAINGPGSKNPCSVALRVVRAETMAPVTSRIQVAIDTTYNVDHPPAYVYGMSDNGTETFSGGSLHEITSQVHNGMVRISNPPASFHLEVNVVTPGDGAASALIYKQCFAPTTVLLYVVKNPGKPSEGGDWLWAKAGKYAAVPAAH